MAWRRRAAVLGTALSLLLGGVAWAGPSRLLLGLGVESVYDGNILEYSNDQIATFESGAHPERFSIESTDDGIFQPNVSLTHDADRGARGRRTIRARWTGAFHAKCVTADNRAGSLSWREEFGRRHVLTLSAYRLPHFYLRQLFDDDVVVPFVGMSRYRRAEFGLTIASAAWRERLSRRSRMTLNYSFERRGYNPDFVERTSNTHESGLGYDWNVKGGGGMGISAAYRTSKARADDGDGVPDDDPDISYHGVVLGANGRVEFLHGRRGRLTGGVDYEYRARDYTSDRPSDTSHFQRRDRLNGVEAELRMALRSRLGVRAFYQFERNAVSFASAIPTASDPASYTRSRVGLDVEWSVVLWKQGSGAEEQESPSP